MIKKPIEILAPFVICHLPDSISQRKQILEALLDLMPRSHAERATVFSLLNLLDTHQNLQRELPGLFCQSGNGEEEGARS